MLDLKRNKMLLSLTWKTLAQKNTKKQKMLVFCLKALFLLNFYCFKNYHKGSFDAWIFAQIFDEKYGKCLFFIIFCWLNFWQLLKKVQCKCYYLIETFSGKLCLALMQAVFHSSNYFWPQENWHPKNKNNSKISDCQ